MDSVSTIINPAAPFDFELTAGYLTYFQGRYGTDSLVDGLYRRLLDLNGKLVLASVRSVGSTERPELAVELRGEGLSPHLTIGRVRHEASQGQRQAIAEAVSSVVLEPTEPWLVESLELMQSTLTPQGAIYTPLGSVALQ